MLLEWSGILMIIPHRCVDVVSAFQIVPELFYGCSHHSGCVAICVVGVTKLVDKLAVPRKPNAEVL